MMVFTFVRRCFFFQAEDGIRDDLVTGVQTCALPIWMDLSLFLLTSNLSEQLKGYCMAGWKIVQRIWNASGNCWLTPHFPTAIRSTCPCAADRNASGKSNIFRALRLQRPRGANPPKMIE